MAMTDTMAMVTKLILLTNLIVGVRTIECGVAFSCSNLVARSPPSTTLEDGHYMLVAPGPGCKLVKVYCADMAGTPLEYITLTGDNYSEDTMTDGTGITVFSKIRIILSHMKIVPNDFRFASLSSGTIYVDYMAALGCSNGRSAPARFKADLTGTGLNFTNHAQTPLKGHAIRGPGPAYDNKVITGECDGSCGFCTLTDTENQLEVDDNSQLLPPRAVLTEETGQDISQLYISVKQSGHSFTLPKTPDNYIAFSSYLEFSLMSKTTITLVVITENVPCLAECDFKVAHIKPPASCPFRQLDSCQMVAQDGGGTRCNWQVTCACAKGSETCLLRMSFYSNAPTNSVWTIKQIGPAFVQ